MTDLVRVWLSTAVAGGVVAALLAVAGRRARLDTAAGRHALAVAVMAASLVALAASAIGPRVVVLVAPGHFDAWQVPAPSSSVTGALLALYLGGVLVLAARLAVGVAALAVLRRESRPLTPGESSRLQRAAGLGESDVRRCHLHARLVCPITLGWRAPLVILPAAATGWPPARLAAVLHHELAHIRRADYLWNLLAASYEALYWPSPLAWLLRRSARQAAELACDHAAAGRVGDRRYARALVQSAREFVAAGQSLGVVAPGAATDVYLRIDAVLRASHRAHRSPPRWLMPAAVACAIGLVLVAGRIQVTSSDPRGAADHAWRHLSHHHSFGWH